VRKVACNVSRAGRFWSRVLTDSPNPVLNGPDSKSMPENKCLNF
jgi:hypothetical protein